MDLEKNTIVIFMTDNGPNGWRFNAGMKGKKGNIDEGGVRVPLFVRWPGIIDSGLEVEENAAHIDILPTLADLCQIPIGPTLPLEGKSLKPLLERKNGDWPDRILFTFPTIRENSNNLRPGAARTQRWRAIKKRGNWELYDIKSDPGQTKNLAEQHSWVLDKLSFEYEKKYKSIIKNIEEFIPIQIGHSESPLVVLPGHEATLYPAAKSGISYHFHPGYTGSWISQWTKTDAYPIWYIDVVKDGDYQIELLYTCEKENVGVELQIEVGDKKLPISITGAHDPPPIPVPFRIEAEKNKYKTKIWKNLSCGKIFLKKGKGILSVKSVKIPGKKSIDLKSVNIKLII
jgi:arylsulfatase A